MADLLPSTPDVSGPKSDEARVIGVDSDAADELLSALSSRTARRILTELHDEPAAPAALAERVDTSLQNVQYHLEKLRDADLVEVADTAYSEKGREMKVYAPVDRALVVVAAREEETTGLKATLKRLLGSVGVLAIGSLVVDRLLGGPTSSLGFSASSGAGAPSPNVGGGASSGSSASSGSNSGSGAAVNGSSSSSSAANSTHVAGTSSTHTTGSSTQLSGHTQISTTGASTAGTTSATTGTQAASSSSATTGTSVASATASGSGTAASGSNVTFTGQTVNPGVHGPPPTSVSPSAGHATASHAAASHAMTVVNTVTASPGLVFFLGGLTALLLLFLLVWRDS